MTLNAGNGNLQTLYVRWQLVVVSRAAGLEPPIEVAGGAALRPPGGEFVDLPVAQRARYLLELAATGA
jgi:hypothetical protein